MPVVVSLLNSYAGLAASATETARALGISTNTLWRKLREDADPAAVAFADRQLEIRWLHHQLRLRRRRRRLSYQAPAGTSKPPIPIAQPIE